MKRVFIYNFNTVSRFAGLYSAKKSDIPYLYLYATSDYKSIELESERRQEMAMLWFVTKPINDDKVDRFLHWMDINLFHQGNQAHISKLFCKIKGTFDNSEIDVSNLDIIYNDCLCPGISIDQENRDRHEYCKRPIFKDLIEKFQGEYILWQIYNLQELIYDANDPTQNVDEILGSTAHRGIGNIPDCRLTPTVIIHSLKGTSYAHMKGLRCTNNEFYCPPTLNSPGCYSAKLFKFEWSGIPEEWKPIKWQVPTIDDLLNPEEFKRKYNCVPLMIKL